MCVMYEYERKKDENIKIKKKVKFSDSKGFPITYFNPVN